MLAIGIKEAKPTNTNKRTLQNLIWKPRAKKWMNHKLFSKTFEYLYPELFFKEKEGVIRSLSS